jgi:predicted esterase
MRRFVASLLLVISFAWVAAAQDADQARRVSVGYRTLRNTTELTSKLSAEALAEVDRLAQMAVKATTDRKYGDALKHYYHAMAILRDQPWTPLSALGAAMTVKLDRQMLEPGASFTLRLGQMFALDKGVEGKLKGAVVLLKPGNRQGQQQVLKELKTLEQVDPDFTARAFTAKIEAPDVAAGNYRVMVRLSGAGAETIEKGAPVHIERGLASKAAAARAQAARVDATLKSASAALVSALHSAQYRIALYDKADRGEINFDRIDFNKQLDEAIGMLDALERGRDPLAARRGEFKKAYLSRVDNTLQPYQLFVPSSYDDSKPHPLIIALHGMGGDENSYFAGYGNGAFKVEAEQRGYIVACPKGRSPASMYLNDAERDVMDVLGEVMRVYKIDPDRVYMTGHSMGGFGSWSIAMNHPGVFAAIAPVAGGSYAPAGMSKITHIPQIVIHGDNDRTVAVARSREMVAMGKKLGAQMKYIEVPGGSHSDVVVPTFKDVFDWFDAHRRRPAEAKAAGAASKN